jgi:hypothetical protein
MLPDLKASFADSIDESKAELEKANAAVWHAKLAKFAIELKDDQATHQTLNTTEKT